MTVFAFRLLLALIMSLQVGGWERKRYLEKGREERAVSKGCGEGGGLLDTVWVVCRHATVGCAYLRTYCTLCMHTHESVCARTGHVGMIISSTDTHSGKRLLTSSS